MKENLRIIPEKKVTAATLMLHGYGSNGKHFLRHGRYLSKFFPNMAFYAPNAYEDYELEPGVGDYQWFSLKSRTAEDISRGLDRCQNYIQVIITDVLDTHDLDYDQLYLFGFSQGCVTALNTIYWLPKLAGILGFSGWFNPKKIPTTLDSNVPIELIHGIKDERVPFSKMKDAATQLELLGFPVKCHGIANLDHSINHQGLEIARNFLRG